MIEGDEGASIYGATHASSEGSKLMATAVAGTASQAISAETHKAEDKAHTLRNGTLSMKIFSYIAGVLLVALGFFSFFRHFLHLRVIAAVVQVYMFIFGWAILVIEVRSKLLPPIILETIHKYFGFLTVVWGRGVFFIFVGTLALAEWKFLYILLGIYLVGLGAGMICWGLQASRSLKGVVREMKDPAVVEATFNKFDYNGNGKLEAVELGKLLESLGAEMKPAQLEAAVLLLDKDNDGYISLQEFQAWWGNAIVNAV
ncbi:unnamed protein product [Ascophyllum nodosum]